MRTWNERLAHALAESDLNPNKLSVALGVSAPSIAAWIGAGTIKRAENITGENLLKVCKLLNVRPEWLLFKEGPMRPTEMKSLTPEMQEVISTLIEIDRSGGTGRDDVLYFMNRLLKQADTSGQKVG